MSFSKSTINLRCIGPFASVVKKIVVTKCKILELLLLCNSLVLSPWYSSKLVLYHCYSNILVHALSHCYSNIRVLSHCYSNTLVLSRCYSTTQLEDFWFFFSALAAMTTRPAVLNLCRGFWEDSDVSGTKFLNRRFSTPISIASWPSAVSCLSLVMRSVASCIRLSSIPGVIGWVEIWMIVPSLTRFAGIRQTLYHYHVQTQIVRVYTYTCLQYFKEKSSFKVHCKYIKT